MPLAPCMTGKIPSERELRNRNNCTSDRLKSKVAPITRRTGNKKISKVLEMVDIPP
jgi:hypothetical protein